MKEYDESENVRSVDELETVFEKTAPKSFREQMKDEGIL